MIWSIGYIFKTQPSELQEMDMDDLNFWFNGVEQIAKWMKK